MRLLYAPILNCRGDVVVDEGVDEWEPKQLITVPCNSVTVSDFKPRKRGLNSRLRTSAAGGGGTVLTHYLITWLEMDGQLDIREGLSSRPGALLEISVPTQIAIGLYWLYTLFFVTGEDDIARFDSRRYSTVFRKDAK